MPTSKLAKHASTLLFIFISAFYLYGLGSFPLVGPDEPRYAEVAREMFLRRDFVTPTLGGLPWFEKPSLLYWLMMVSYRVFGVNEFAARLGPALCGLITAAVVWWLGTSVETLNESPADDSNFPIGLGRASALMFLSSLGAIAFSRAASFDVVLTATITGALACFFVWHLRSRASDDASKPSPALLIGFYFFIGLSLLAKGLVGIVVPFGIVGIYFLIRREWPKRNLLLSLFWGMPIAFGVAAIWYGPMIYRHGWVFIDQFFIQHHFARFLSNKFHHPQPFYYYLPTLAWLSLPWTIFLLASFFSRARREQASEAKKRLAWFALIWVLVPLVFFSLSESKLPGYILPVLPAVALLAAREAEGRRQKPGRDWVTTATGILIIAITGAAAWYSIRVLELSGKLAVAASIAAAVIGLGVVILQQRKTLAWLLIALTPFVVSVSTIQGARVIAERTSTRDLIRAADARGYVSAPVFYMLCDDRTAEFYAGGRLAYQPNGEPFRFDGAQDLAAAIRQKGGFGLVLIETRWEHQLTDYAAVQTERIGSNRTLTLFVVRLR